jgi:EmrB/QacA subfamily drug resistance transporter
MAMGAMEATVVSTVMPSVVSDLHRIELYGWIGSIYMLASTVAIPLWGKLCDLFGRKRLMLLGIAIFLIGSMLSGMAQTMEQLIVFRAIQAVGGGALQSIAFTIIGDIYTAQERARIQGLFGSVWALAGMLGPLLGGLIVKYLSWRWVFYVNVPLGVVAAGLLVVGLHERLERRERSIDLLGAALLAGTVISLLLGLSRSAPKINLPLALVLGVLFVLQERRAKEPVLPLALLGRRVLAVSSASGALLGSVMMASAMFIPLYVQAVLHLSPTAAGVTLTPLLLGMPIASTLSGRSLGKLGYRRLIRGGFVLATTATLVLWWLVAHRGGVWPMRAAVFLLGLGLGTTNTPLIVAVQESVTFGERGVATASMTFFRSIGGAILVGGLGAVLASALGRSVPHEVVNRLFGPERGRDLPLEILRSVEDDLGNGLSRIYATIAAVSCLGLLTSLTFPDLQLGQTKKPPARTDERPEITEAAAESSV